VDASVDNRNEIAAAEHRVAGVAYTSIDGAPGAFFTCQPYRAKLSTTACAARWRATQRSRGEAAEQIIRCRGCSIGAQHAGERYIARSAIFGTARCPRCGSGSTRMIANRLCVSCYNREFEVRRGRNAKGTKPTISLAERRIGVLIDIDKPGECWRVDVVGELAVDMVEMIAQILRVAVGRVAFTAPGKASITVKLHEFADMMDARVSRSPATRRLRGAARR
jgi:hypothetical protein